MENFTVSPDNPNDLHGLGACLCSPSKDRDCDGPYIVFGDQLLEGPNNPLPVMCERCVRAAVRKFEERSADEAAFHGDPEAEAQAAADAAADGEEILQI